MNPSYAELIDTIRVHLNSLPMCDECEFPATRAWGRGRGRWCDKHGTAPLHGSGDAPEYPRAATVRKLQQIVEGYKP